MSEFVTKKHPPAERIYPAVPMQFAQAAHTAGSCREREMRASHIENGPIFPARSTL
ncbi:MULTISPECIES: hypothetical protein [unclassified Bradyrhizobium]|uniref:hypothetical protein n=1 Tax=unclassified Bradyrhizobium TaxID=2631580 RepID=UPI001FFB3512|nr:MULTISPECIES: hypothetical protein [unclassified Bradyrhizobium]MCK1710693.1 hypothetical protein [Bradyrhizobium sp. 143]MCK1724372.1 hypothetical protein [Bradyrhizobium sp. 142]